MAIVFIGMETSGELRRRFHAAGLETYSCDLLPCEDDGSKGTHIVGDVFSALDDLRAKGKWPDLAIFHPDCTYHTLAAAWAFGDGPYHQKVRPETLVGERRRQARLSSEKDVERIAALPIEMKVMENPRGTIPTRTSLGSPACVLQPYECGDDASKATCLWMWGLPPIVPRPHLRLSGRLVEWPKGSGKFVERWANQTDSGQNRATPSDNRWSERSRTFPGVADVIVEHCIRHLTAHQVDPLIIWLLAA